MTKRCGAGGAEGDGMQEEMFARAERLARHLPGVEVSTYYGGPALKAAGKAFAGVSREPGAMWTACPIELKPILIEAQPDYYFDTDHFSGWPGLLVRMDAIDDESLAARLEAAWLMRAPAKLVRAWEAERPSEG